VFIRYRQKEKKINKSLFLSLGVVGAEVVGQVIVCGWWLADWGRHFSSREVSFMRWLIRCFTSI
jgi:hypothetical protein